MIAKRALYVAQQPQRLALEEDGGDFLIAKGVLVEVMAHDEVLSVLIRGQKCVLGIELAPRRRSCDHGGMSQVSLIDCPACGKQVSSAAPTCLHCGHPMQQAITQAAMPAKPSKRSPLAVFGVIIGALALTGVCVSVGDDEPTDGPVVVPTPDRQAASVKGAQTPKPPPKPAPDALVVTAKDLWSAYDANEVAADEQYKGKRLIVTGKLQSIDKGILDDVVLKLRTKNQFLSVHATLRDSEKAAAAALKKGVTVKVRCIGDGLILGSPLLKKCRLLETAPTKKKGRPAPGK